MSKNRILKRRPDFAGKRIGIYAGTFNPVHSGHLAFALQALDSAGLDKIYFLPERRPRYKQGVEHFAHRAAMLKKATSPHPKLAVLELVDVEFTIARTLPKLQGLFEGAQLVFLFGSDAALQVSEWQNYERLLKNAEMVIGMRQKDSEMRVLQAMHQWPHQPQALYMFGSFAPTVSSREVREALYQRQAAPGLLPSVRQYSNHHWLYVSLA